MYTEAQGHARPALGPGVLPRNQRDHTAHSLDIKPWENLLQSLSSPETGIQQARGKVLRTVRARSQAAWRPTSRLSAGCDFGQVLPVSLRKSAHITPQLWDPPGGAEVLGRLRSGLPET